MGSYFDKQSKQCKWVGEGNYNCDTILGKTTSSSESTSDTDKKDDEDKDDEPSTVSTTEKENLNSNKQKIFYDLSSAKLQPDTVIPPDLYTCLPDVKENTEVDSDYIKCYSCEDTGRCQNATVIPCYLKTQKCYTKGLFNSNTNQMVAFSKGCASKTDLESFLSELTEEQINPTKKNGHQTNCVRRTKGTKVCYDLCESNMCNAKHDFASDATRLLVNLRSMFLILLAAAVASWCS